MVDIIEMVDTVVLVGAKGTDPNKQKPNKIQNM